VTVAPRWFIQTRGGSHLDDYGWRSLDGGDPHEAARIVREGWQDWSCVSNAGGRRRLLDDEEPGLLLFSATGSAALTLLVTGLVSSQVRADFAGRSIRVNLLGVAARGDEDGQRRLVAVAVRALRGRLPLEPLVGQGPSGMTPHPGSWPGLVESAVAELAREPGQAITPGSEVLPDSDDSRGDVASGLAALCNRGELPAWAGRLLVLWTGILSPAAIAALQPGWGLRPDRPYTEGTAGLPRGAAGDADPRRVAAELASSLGRAVQPAVDAAKEGVHEALEVAKKETAKKLEERRRRRGAFGAGAGLLLIGASVGIALALSSGGTSPGAAPSLSSSRSSTSTLSPSPTPSPVPSAWQVDPSGALSLPGTSLTGLATLPPDEAVAAGTVCAAAGCASRSPFVGFWSGGRWATKSIAGEVGYHLPVSPPVVAASSLDDVWVFVSAPHGHSYVLQGGEGGWAHHDLPSGVSVYKAAVTGPGNVWAFATTTGGVAYVGHYTATSQGTGAWQQVNMPSGLIGQLSAISVAADGSIWVATTAGGHSMLLRSDGGTFQQAGTLPEVPAQVLVVSQGDIWEVGSQGIEHGDGSSSGWTLVADSPSAVLASDGTDVWWVSGGTVFHSSGGPPVPQPISASAAAGMKLTTLAWAPSATPHALWALLSSAGQATGGSTTIIRYTLTG
jgi:hypothetical protein